MLNQMGSRGQKIECIDYKAIGEKYAKQAREKGEIFIIPEEKEYGHEWWIIRPAWKNAHAQSQLVRFA